MLALRRSVDPFILFRSEIDRLVDEHLGTAVPGEWRGRQLAWPAAFSRQAKFPALNVWENEECYFAEAECPGLNMQDLELSITGNQLLISGERKDEYSEKTSFHRQERGTGRFSRMLSLPTEVDSAKVEASLKNGVLTIRMPKAESAKPKRIEVKS